MINRAQLRELPGYGVGPLSDILARGKRWLDDWGGKGLP